LRYLPYFPHIKWVHVFEYHRRPPHLQHLSKWTTLEEISSDVPGFDTRESLIDISKLNNLQSVDLSLSTMV
jgi:hypothetical protein